MLADDLKLYMEINSISDCCYLQFCLILFYHWCIRKRELISTVFDYNLKRVVLKKPDLGISFDSKFYFINLFNAIVENL